MITPEELLGIYDQGLFPMAESADDPSFAIFEPIRRSILPIDNLHISKSLRKKVLKPEFEIRINTAFKEVIDACGENTAYRENTWINHPIKMLFLELHQMGHAHSVESWKDNQLVGGLYGLQLGGAFCGESMFSRKTDASKVALVHLCARLQKTGFMLLDAQLENPHLSQFGQQIITQEDYLLNLRQAKIHRPDFMTTNMTEAELVKNYLK
jgi:leucyl/phenylalanyl-tRNA--protein transferase